MAFNLKNFRWFGIHTKGLEANRAELPVGGVLAPGGYDYHAELLAALRGVDLRRPKLDTIREAGDVRFNSIVSICINWIGTSWPEAPVALGKRKGAQIEPTEQDHQVLKMLRRPNPMYRGRWLAWALLSDWWATGTAYAHIVTSGATNLTGMPVELEWLPRRYMTPKAGTDGRLEYYEYAPNGNVRHFDPKEVIQFRYGVNHANPLEGVSPLLAQSAYLVADNAGGQYTAGLLHYGGLPPALMVPDYSGLPPGVPARPIDKDKAESLTDDLTEKMMAEPGKMRFVGNAVKILTLGYKPSEMNLNELMEEPETRIPAAFGIPPEVLKLRVGLLHSTENNIKESRKAAWQDCIGPAQDIFGEEWTEGLLIPRFPGNENNLVHYDRRHVGVLQPDMSQLRQDAALLHDKGVLDRYDSKTLAGAKPEDADKGVYKTASAPADPNADPTADPAKDPGKPNPAQKKTLIIG